MMPKASTPLRDSAARRLTTLLGPLLPATLLLVSACVEQGRCDCADEACAAAANASHAGASAERGGGAAELATAGAAAAGGAGTAAAGTAGAAGDAPNTAAAVFEDGQLLEYWVTIDPADWEQLQEQGNDEEYRPADVAIHGSSLGSQAFEQVGVRLKGAWTLHHCWDEFGGVRSYADECAKLSYKIKFNEYDPDLRFEGLKRINLHASSGDDTMLRELLAYSIFNDFGVRASRAAPAKLYVNRELLGLYIAVEQVDGRFAEFHFPAGGDGNLFKEVWPRTGLDDGYFISGLRTNEDNPDVSDMQDFAAAIAATTEETFERELEAWIDLDATLRYIAVDRALKNWDGIMAFYSPLQPHNYYWYHESSAGGRFVLIPWDLDGTLWPFDPFTDPQQWVTATEPVPDWNVLPASCEPISVWEPNSGNRVTPPGCDQFLGTLAATQWDRFVEIGNALLESPFDDQAMADKVTQWAALIEPVVAEDPYLDAAEWRDERDDFCGTLTEAVADFRAFLAEGYRVEEPLEPLPEPSAEELDAPMPEGGIVVDRVNNFEFTDGVPGVAPAGVFSYGADGVTHAATWNISAPLSGAADLRLVFEFTRNPGAWNEYVDVVIPTASGQEIDIREYAQISITLQADRTREVSICVSSPAYEDEFGGVWADFGANFVASAEPTTVKLRLDRLFYPDWAKDAWTTGQGWTTSDSEALQVLLERFSGLRFGPGATLDASGELTSEVESGSLQIDNIYFQ